MPAAVECREIDASDRTKLLDLFAEGFPSRPRAFWNRTFDRLASRACPEGYPRYGYGLFCHGRAVGALLLIYSHFTGSGSSDGKRPVRCSLSTWYVAPDYRVYATLLVSRARRDKSVTYLNLTPNPETYSLVAAQGYTCFTRGEVLCAPLLRRAPGITVETFNATTSSTDGLSATEVELLRDHSSYDCLCLVALGRDARRPFVFLPRRGRIIGRLVAQLIWCRTLSDFTECAGPLGRHLLRRGFPVVEVDSEGPEDGLPGLARSKPKFYSGPIRPRPADYAYTEIPILGL
jgi:hypothetical protein